MEQTLEATTEEEFRKRFFSKEAFTILGNDYPPIFEESQKARDEFRGNDYKRFVNLLVYHLTSFIPDTIRSSKIKIGIYRHVLGAVGEDVQIKAGFRFGFGKNIYLSDNVYINYECLFLDSERIFIGDNVSFGPRVCLYTIGHYYTPDDKIQNTRKREPIFIDENVWIGGNSIILPGVYIGKDSIVAAGSVVKDNVPRGVMVAGTPARVVKKLT